MNVKSSAITVMILVLFLIIVGSGCAQLEDQVLALATRTDAFDATGDQPHKGSTLLFIEAERELALMNFSEYTHTTFIDEENVTYLYDCSGFVGYALLRADPCAFSILLHERPDVGNFYYHLVQFGAVPVRGGWMRVPAPLELRRGDIIVWLKPDSSDTKSSGHIMIVAGNPVTSTERKDEILVRVIDSTTSRHADDSRSSGRTGLGEGTIGIMTGSSGNPIGYYWRGGESTEFQKTEMVFARIA